MSTNIESPRLTNIRRLAEKLTPFEKLSLSELLTADARNELRQTEQQVARFVKSGESSLRQDNTSTIGDSDEWSEEDLAELREASMHYVTAAVQVEGKQQTVLLSNYAGVGSELWQKIDIEQYIQQERDTQIYL